MTLVSREDREGIEEVLVRYATAIDTRDWDLLRTCFSEHCDADYGEIGHWHGAEEITAWMARTHDPLGPTMHRITNFAVKAAADRVTSRCYVHAVVTTGDRSTSIHAFGWYDDEWEPTGEGWRIGSRLFTTVTTQMHPHG